ncbi:MAG: GTPase/DUF3482 domain-containing protein [Limisphaerales bacterium]
MNLPQFAVVGHPNKGKSSIVATLAMDDSVRIGPQPGTTQHCRRYPMSVDEKELYALIDTPGFQRARRALQWMRQHETTADRHSEVVQSFVETHRNTGQFHDECELLQPIIDGAGILYVVDGSVPYGEEYEPEMEILRWTGQPSLALINPIGPPDYVEPWQAALSQYFKVVRVFNASIAEFSKHLELLRAFGQLREDWRAPLQQAVDILQSDRQHRRRLAARQITNTLIQILAHKVERKLPDSPVPASTDQAALEETFRSELRALEQQSRDAIEALYSHRQLERRETELSWLEEDLFSEKTWLIFGLSRKELAATGAMGGAAAGALIDAHLAGASLLLGALVGAGVGGAVGWWTANRLVKVRIKHLPLGGKSLVAGPSTNPNLPHIIFNRARLHHHLLTHRNHSVRSAFHLPERPEDVLAPLDPTQRQALEKCFRRLRKRPDDPQAKDQLASVIEGLLEVHAPSTASAQ